MDPRPRDAERPIAVLKSRRWVGFAADPCFLFLIAILAVAVATGFARFLPWPPLAGGAGLEGLVLLVGLVGLGALVAIQRWGVARIGQAELFADRLVIKHQRRLLSLRLSDVVSFNDDSGDYVRLTFEGAGHARSQREVTVPTPDETDRAALVGALALKPPLWPLGWAGVLVSVVVLPAIAAAWSRPRTGIVRFHDDRIAIAQPTIPTHTPEDRAAVEKLLATRGVPRLS